MTGLCIGQGSGQEGCSELGFMQSLDLCMADLHRGSICSGLESGQGWVYAGLCLCVVTSGSSASAVEICLNAHTKACHVLSKAVHHILNYLCAHKGNGSPSKGLYSTPASRGQAVPSSGTPAVRWRGVCSTNRFCLGILFAPFVCRRLLNVFIRD